ncbi:50S ribosomal protein L15 [bacterium]|nr:50S ribosomal protein L15 [bacterium]
MITLHQLTKVKTKKPKKRRGRGYGSGKGGHTVGRGSKGQKARGKIDILFTGTKGKKSWFKRLPLWRGKGRFKSSLKPVVVNVGVLDKFFRSGERVTVEALVRKGLVDKKEKKRVKILGKGKLTKKLIVVSLPCSKKAAEKIKAAGGKTEK